MGTSLLEAGDALNGEGWGLHDALWLRTRIDWRARTLELDLELAISERQDRRRPASFAVEGLVFFVAEAPHPHHEAEPYWDRRGARIDARSVSADAHARAGLPPLPPGAWCCYVWDDGANTVSYVAGRHCAGRWTGEPYAARGDVLFPGDRFPSSKA